MKKTLLLLFLIFQTVTASKALAAWYEVTGQSPVLESDIAARTRALEDAVFQALRFSGADIAGLNAMKPYFDEVKGDYIFSGNEMRHIMVVNERIVNGKYLITARMDIYPTANTCHKSQYKKGVVLSRFHIISPQQATLGGIYQFGDDFTVLLQRQIEANAQSFVTQGITNVAISPNAPMVASMVADDNSAQFIVSGEITDLSATSQQSMLGEQQTNRQLALNINVMEGRTGDVVYQSNYREVAQWPFERHSQVDTKTARFWQSPYGEMARRMSRNILLDLESALSCRASTPEIVMVNDGSAQINAGRTHGVQQGDQLQLWHNASFTDQYGNIRQQRRKSDATLTVTRVYENSAEVAVAPANLTGSIQIGDMITKHLK